MGGIRANWFTDMPEIPITDPFAQVKSVDPIPDVATLDLSELISREARLADRGVTCGRKDADWCRPTCVSCPLARTPDIIALCKIGMAQERILAADGLAAA